MALSVLQQAKEIHKKGEWLLQQWKEHFEEYDIQSLLTDLTGILKSLHAQIEALHFFMQLADDHFVYWIEVSQQAKIKSLQLHSVPIDVSALLQNLLFEQKESIVMTSATLAVNQSFQYAAQQLGLRIPEDEHEGKLKTLQLESPFDFKQQALVIIPTDFPDIKNLEGEHVFLDRLSDSLSKTAIVSKGRMLVLFTSHRMLKEIYPKLKGNLQSYGIDVLGQGLGGGNRSKLTRLFQSSSACVLLGTNSFWEGVDIPGEALSCLVIVRLPFQPPNHPFVEAKCEQLKKRNENPFIKYSVPQAVIRFKQGFGRLVRRTTDRGVVIIYDTRVIDTTYGKYFLNSLPKPSMERIDDSLIPLRVKEWMEVMPNEVDENF
jgi:ATP-dependent DNA helicase DinG